MSTTQQQHGSSAAVTFNTEQSGIKVNYLEGAASGNYVEVWTPDGFDAKAPIADGELTFTANGFSLTANGGEEKVFGKPDAPCQINLTLSGNTASWTVSRDGNVIKSDSQSVANVRVQHVVSQAA